MCMDDVTKQSFYQVHLYVRPPVLYLLELLLDFVCLEQDKFDLVYMTELDPFWAENEQERHFKSSLDSFWRSYC